MSASARAETRASTTPGPRSQPLFRERVMQARRSQWLGPVLLVSPLSHTFYALLALAVVVAVVTFATFGQYTRKARVNGWLVPAQGMVRVFAQQPGVVVAIHVREGARVAKGEPLLVLSSERRSAGLGATQAEITRLLGARRDSLQAEIAQQQALSQQQRVSATRRLAAIRGEIEHFDKEIELQSSRASLATAATERLVAVFRAGGAAQQDIDRQQEAVLEQRARLSQLERTRAERRRELATLQAELDEMPFKHLALEAGLQRNIRALEQEMAESEARRETVILAPHDGTVTSIQAEAGGNASTTTPLLSIVPASVSLQAHLYATSRSIGFVQPGQEVLLRFQAFPYQKFGHVTGKVDWVSRAPLSPAEVPTQLAGLTSLVGSNEPIYRIVVNLDRQSVNAYAIDRPLQPGMQLESDVLLETRRLWEWALEPLFTLTGRL